ncbi:hypothetical protein [Haloplanus aerogenes]|uniref:Uncharacterized protein n=1 Tax=Haloplanus aerogenes TaxID=660522 RepID=A0A3M0DRS7_9EURY|nr:hypothetical protein [Haloplanus aerogenes]AZH24228.1 hypothetical protein DU502_02050 [Haloplanus aerogenes]RMB24144.1 hypothetical protein ATH50_1384 [Haloplanus aerogenes]
MTTRRERVGWALLFSLPMGVGVGLATARMARAGPTHPLVVGAAVTTAALVAALILVATGVSTTEVA